MLPLQIHPLPPVQAPCRAGKRPATCHLCSAYAQATGIIGRALQVKEPSSRLQCHWRSCLALALDEHSGACAQVWSVQDSDWACKVDEGPAGIDRVCWSSDGQHLIIVTDFQIRLTIWSLRDRSCVHVVGPKKGDHMTASSSDGSYLALLEVHSWADLPATTVPASSGISSSHTLLNNRRCRQHLLLGYLLNTAKFIPHHASRVATRLAMDKAVPCQGSHC